jgi:hypothetical protein
MPQENERQVHKTIVNAISRMMLTEKKHYNNVLWMHSQAGLSTGLKNNLSGLRAEISRRIDAYKGYLEYFNDLDNCNADNLFGLLQTLFHRRDVHHLRGNRNIEAPLAKQKMLYNGLWHWEEITEFARMVNFLALEPTFNDLLRQETITPVNRTFFNKLNIIVRQAKVNRDRRKAVENSTLQIPINKNEPDSGLGSSPVNGVVSRRASAAGAAASAGATAAVDARHPSQMDSDYDAADAHPDYAEAEVHYDAADRHNDVGDEMYELPSQYAEGLLEGAYGVIEKGEEFPYTLSRENLLKALTWEEGLDSPPDGLTIRAIHELQAVCSADPLILSELTSNEFVIDKQGDGEVSVTAGEEFDVDAMADLEKLVNAYRLGQEINLAGFGKVHPQALERYVRLDQEGGTPRMRNDSL